MDSYINLDQNLSEMVENFGRCAQPNFKTAIHNSWKYLEALLGWLARNGSTLIKCVLKKIAKAHFLAFLIFHLTLLSKTTYRHLANIRSRNEETLTRCLT